MARQGVSLGLEAQSIGVFVPGATEKWPESRPVHCLWPQARVAPIRATHSDSSVRGTVALPQSRITGGATLCQVPFGTLHILRQFAAHLIYIKAPAA
jgi:hypothetical protein